MGPKRIAVIVVAVIAAIGVVTSVIAVALAARPRENRFAIGTQTSHSSPIPPASTHPATPATSSTTGAVTTPTPTPQEPDLPSPVLAAAAPRVVPNTTALGNKIRAIKVKGMTGSYSGSVVEVGTGKVLYAHNAKSPQIPASTMKLLTATAALSILGPDHTFRTSVVSPQRGQIVLVGGGDPYLAKNGSADYPRRATITGLARATASKLKQDKITKVSVGYEIGRAHV